MHNRRRIVRTTPAAASMRSALALLVLMAFVFAATTPNLAVAAFGLDGRLCNLQPHAVTSSSSLPMDAGVPSILDQCCIICVVAQNLAGGLSHQHFTLPIIGDATGTVAFQPSPDPPQDRFTGFSRRARAPPVVVAA